MSAIDEYLQQILDAVYGEEVRGAIHDAIWQVYEDGQAGVPMSRTINGKPLSSDITLSASDVGAVPTTLTVNSKPLSSNITLSASDVGAVDKTGDTMTGRLNAPNITSYGGSWPAFRFSLNSDGESSLGSVNFDTRNNRIAFISKSNNDTNTREIYRLPASSGTDGETTDYEILTTKPLDATTAATVRINLGLGSLATKSSLAASDIPALSYLPIAGGTMTGQIVLSSTGYKTSSTNGYYTNSYGNFIHADTTTASSWNIQKNDGTPVFTINYESGATTMPGQLLLSKTTDVNGGASSECALVIGAKTGGHLAFDTNEIMAKTSATEVGTLNLNYDGGNILMGVSNTSYYVQIRSTAAATSTTTGALRVGGGVGVGGSVYAGGDVTIQGPTYPSFALKKSDGTALGSLYASVNSGRMMIRTWNSTGTKYTDYCLPDDSDNDADRARYFLTTKDFDFVNYSGTSGTAPGVVKSGAGIWLVSAYDSDDPSKYWVGIVDKKASTNPAVTKLANNTITCSGGNTIGTLIFSGGNSYIVKTLKIA